LSVYCIRQSFASTNFHNFHSIMSCSSVSILSCFTVLILSSFLSVVEANAFLKASPSLREERVSEEDVQSSLLAEVEGAFGEGAASSRVKQLEAVLSPIYAALPKNEQGYLGHSTVRYALHRLFVQRHGWVIKGLDTEGGHRNSTSSAGLLKEQVPGYIQDLFEKRLGGRGFGLNELAVLAATIEHLVHNEAIKRLGDAMKIHDRLPTSLLKVRQADEVLDTYMTAYIMGEDLSNMSIYDVLDLKAEMPELYLAWNETKDFVRKTRQDVTSSDGTTEQKTSEELDFALVARVAERVGERFGSFQNEECKQIKASLLNLEEPGTGRVRLSDFYKPAVGGHWQFQESMEYLRQLGALDESDPVKPRVIVANYISSPTNCIASSSFYSVCCMDECEGLLGHLEQQIAAPEATSTQVAKLVSELSSSSVVAPRKLSQSLLDRLGEIAAQHGGRVPLHGRLFAQWMHHAFPRECPFPHLSGTTNPQTPDEWLEATGKDVTATHKEMQVHVDTAEADPSPSLNDADDEEIVLKALPWSPEEELLVVRPPHTENAVGGTFLRNLVMCMVVASVAYGLLGKASTTSKLAQGWSAEKQLV